MTQRHSSDRPGRVYRVDKFVVPSRAREEFLSRVRDTHKVLRAQPGFLRDLLLEETAGPDHFNVVTIVEWDGPDSVKRAKAAVTAMHKERGFNPRETMERLGIRADIGTYKRVDD
jgi:heme-degrading monooxygenase HmoA